MPIIVKVPASTANLGPGFDVLGAGLSLYLTLTLTLNDTTILEYIGDSPEVISLNPSENYITRIMQYMANSFKMELPKFKLLIENPIPLGRGLGSSGSAVVAAVEMANKLLNLNLTRNDLLDFSTIIEGHPDNVGGSIFGWNASYARANLPEFKDGWFLKGSNVETPTTILSKTRRNWQLDGDESSPTLSGNLITSVPIKINPTIKCVVAIPKFQLLTSKARQVLPKEYARSNCIFNLSRVSALVLLLSQTNLDPLKINEAMQDCIHQPFRAKLVPGLIEILKLSGDDLKGLLGTCLSGAGPTVLALCVSNFEQIGQTMVDIFSHQGIESSFMVLEFDSNGVQTTSTE